MKSFDTPEFWQFVTDNAGADTRKLRLHYHGKDDADGVDYPLAITQIECRQKFGSKLRDTLAANPRFLFPNELAGEQSTSDLLATFHSSLLTVGETVTDLTAGLGIDALHFAAAGHTVLAVDRQEKLAEALRFNAATMRLPDLTAMHADSTALLTEDGIHSDVAFIDPARRSADGGRVYAIADCQPDVVALLPLLRRHFSRLVIKLSPMLDVTQTMRDLGPELESISITGTVTECKELVAVMRFGTETPIDDCPVRCVTLGTAMESVFHFTRDDEQAAPAGSFGVPRAGDYVYELYPAVMKGAPFRTIQQRFTGLYKLSANTHVFYSRELIPEIPGIARRVSAVIPWQSKNIKRLKTTLPQADVAVRNFGMSAADLQKKLGLRPGGPHRLLAVTDTASTRHLLILTP